MSTKKLFGATLLISGACIGAGMLALPIIMASLGLRLSIYTLIGMCLFMSFTGLLVIEANLWLPLDTSYISMAESTLGRKGKIVTWITYTLLLYSLLAAYTTIGGQLITTIELKYLGHGLPHWTSYGIWTLIFAVIIYSDSKPIINPWPYYQLFDPGCHYYTTHRSQSFNPSRKISLYIFQFTCYCYGLWISYHYSQYKRLSK